MNTRLLWRASEQSKWAELLSLSSAMHGSEKAKAEFRPKWFQTPIYLTIVDWQPMAFLSPYHHNKTENNRLYTDGRRFMHSFILVSGVNQNSGVCTLG